jgi:chaperonin GroEL
MTIGHPKSRRLAFQPKSYRSLQAGANQIIDAIRPTMGPLPRITAIDRILDERPPERLDSGGVIAKRIIQLPDVHADVGAMLVRDFLWQLEEQEGDGTATAAVLFQTIFDEGIRHVTAGHNARLLHTHLLEGMKLILAELSRMARPVTGEAQIAKVAETICHDRGLSELLGEIFDIVGEHGRLEIRKGEGRSLRREYVEGMYWDQGLFSREMITSRPGVRVELENPAILTTDLQIREPDELLPVLACALKNGMRKLLIIAGDISDAGLAFLLANNRDPEKLQIVAVRTPGYGAEEQAWAITDIVTLCGGRTFVRGASDSLRGIEPQHFGHARRAWAGFESFGLIAGKGDPRNLRRHIGEIKRAFDETPDLVLRAKIQKRLGKLLGGSATLRIGGVTEPEIEERLQLAEHTASAVRGALRDGVVPGGGAALLRCQPLLMERARQSSDNEESAAYRILASAVAAPMRTISHNAGYDASDVLAEVRARMDGHGFDVLSGQAVDMHDAGIVDPASVVMAAAHTGISSAALALTIDVLVHRTEQPTRAIPRTPAKRKKLQA